MARAKAVAGISDHAGWAVAVCVANGEVIDRRRIELLEPGLPTMPYHHDAQGLPAEEAEALIARVRQSAALYAADALAALQANVEAIAIRKRPPLPATVAERIASYHAQTRADGVMYRDVLAEAAQTLGLDDITPLLDAIGETLGPPWQKDHRFAAAAAIAASRT